MPQIIDSFLVELGFDTKGLTKGQKEAIDAQDKTQKAVIKSGKIIEGESKKATEFLSKLTKQVIELYAVFLGGRGLKEFVADITASDSALGRLSRNVNLSVGTLGQWETAARLAGGTAEGMAQTFQTFSDNIQQLKLTGQSNVIPLFRALEAAGHTLIDQSKPLPDIILAISSNLQTLAKTDRPEADYLARQLGFADPAFRAALLEGPGALQAILDVAKRSAPTAADAKAAIDRQLAWARLVATWEQASRVLVTALTPAIDWFVRVLTRLGEWFGKHEVVFATFTGAMLGLSIVFSINLVAGIASAVFGLNTLKAALLNTAAIGVGGGLLGKLLGLGAIGTGVAAGAAIAQPGAGEMSDVHKYLNEHPNDNSARGLANRFLNWLYPSSDTGRATLGGGPDTAAYIRQSAIAHGIDPDIAMAVAKSEGLNSYTGDNGSSFGPFQLHYGNVAGGGNAVGGLGDEFTKATGLDARDPSTIQAQIDFAMAYAAQHGWGAWHGWRGAANAGIGGTTTGSVSDALRRASQIPLTSGLGAGAAVGATYGPQSNNTSSSETHVGTVVVHTAATDAKGIANDMKIALQRTSFAANANFSLV
jgi:hypothetical protein